LSIRVCLRQFIVRSLKVRSFAFYSCSLSIYNYVFCAVLGFCFFCNITHTYPPYMKFLFVGSNICRQLLSDSQSPTTPLLLANDKYCNSRSGLTPYSLMTMPDTQKSQKEFTTGLSLVGVAGFEPTTLPNYVRIRYIVCYYLLISQTLKISSASNIFNLTFFSNSGGTILKIFNMNHFPRYPCFCRFIPTRLMTVKPLYMVFTLTHVIPVK